MFGSEKAKNGYTLMVQMYFALQINQKRRTGMNSISEKELLALNDLLGEEELLIKKFKMLANHAEDEEIKDKFEQISTDKEVLQDSLTAEKTATNNYNTYANECVHDTVREAILNCLSEEHKIQEEVFNAMHTRGLYPTPEAEDKKVDEAKQKFSCTYKSL